jgi:hypothetical protein
MMLMLIFVLCRVFVGAREVSSSSIQVGAFGLSNEVFKATNDSLNGHENNGVYWYNYEGRSFGFSPEQSIRLDAADVSSSNSNYRLSWYVDRGIGGYRVGSLCPNANGVREARSLTHEDVFAAIYSADYSHGSSSGDDDSSFYDSCVTSVEYVKVLYKKSIAPRDIPPPVGIVHNYDVAKVQSRGLQLCYQAYYAYSTRQSDLLNCVTPGSW